MTIVRFETVLEALSRSVRCGWTRIPSPVGVRWTYTHTVTRQTPEWAKDGYIKWSQDTYNSVVLLTPVGRKVIMRRHSAPWVRADDFDIPNWMALAILADPEIGHDRRRMLLLQRERAAARKAR